MNRQDAIHFIYFLLITIASSAVGIAFALFCFEKLECETVVPPIGSYCVNDP